MPESILTYSSLRDFRNCRRRYFNRFVREIVPAERDANLTLGSGFHRALESWFRLDLEGRAKDAAAVEIILGEIDALYPNRDADLNQKRLWHLNQAMFQGYVNHYPSEPFHIVDVEKEFAAPLINPASGRSSRSFAMRGKVDLLVQMCDTGEYFIVEHKSAAQISGDYIDKLPLDLQVALYAHYLAEDMGIAISGVIYDVVAKAKLKQGQGETEEEFAIRRAELIAKSKTGKSSAKRKLPESDEEYAARLAEKYADPLMYCRETLLLSQDDIRETVAEVWELSQQLLLTRRTNQWFRNTDICFGMNRPCPYFPLCRSNDNPNVLENLYVTRPAHSELSTEPDEPASF